MKQLKPTKIMKKQTVFTFCAFLLCTISAFAQPKLHILRDFNGGSVFGLSSDGKYAAGGIEGVVGFRYDIKNETWVAYAYDHEGNGNDVSNDGLIVGVGLDSAYKPPIQSAFIWNDDSVYTFLGIRPGTDPQSPPSVGSLAYAITGDSRFIAGSTPVLKSELINGNPPAYNLACVWNNNPGNITVTALPDANKHGMGSRASAISDNGKVISGFLNTNTSSEALLWINRKSPIILSFDDQAEEGYRAYAQSVSPNARFVAGYYESGVSFLWDAFKQDTLYRIENPSVAYMADGVSSGGTIVGFQCEFQAPGMPINNPMERQGFIKLPGEEPQLLEAFLEERGIYATDENVRLTTPINISFDGRVIAGFGWDDVNMSMVPFVVDLGEALDKGDLTPYDPTDSTINNENIHTQIEKVSMYPNPARDVLNVDGKFDQVRIFDVCGKEVFYSPSHCRTIALNKFKKGIYFVKFEGKTGSQTSKLIVQ